MIFAEPHPHGVQLSEQTGNSTLPGEADLCHELKMILRVDDQQGASREAFSIQKLDGHYWFLDSDFADSVFICLCYRSILMT